MEFREIDLGACQTINHLLVIKARLADYPTRFYIESESESGVEYLVDLCAFPRGEQQGIMIFNGSCGVPGEPDTMCKDFRFRCMKAINKGFICRCKHIRFARENCIDFILPRMAAADPNLHEDLQC